MVKKLRSLVIGAGDRGKVFGRNVREGELDITIKGIADPWKERRDNLAKDFKIPKSNLYSSGEKALESGKKFDLVYIATPDKRHHKLAVMALRKGYNVLLEKPMATTPKMCMDIINAKKKSGKFLAVCHVLRYAPFFQKINEVISLGDLGRVRSIDLMEEVAYWHFAHSYVRGNWRNESKSSPVILAKSCHDLDVLLWLSESSPDKIFSRGSLDFFRKENAPEGALDRCTDGCPVKKCPFDARKFYLDLDDQDETKGPYSVISEDHSEEGRKKALETTNYGKCVFGAAGNDVCDNQEVSIEFKNNVKATFLLRSGGITPTREIFIYFEWGEIYGDLDAGYIKKTRYSGKWGEDNVEEMWVGEKGGHGGGDKILLNNVVNMILSGDEEKNLTSAEKALDSHLMAFASEKSRKNKKLVDFNNYKKGLNLE